MSEDEVRGAFEPATVHDIDPENPIEPMAVEQFLAIQIPPRETMLAPWLPAQGLVMVYAERGVGVWTTSAQAAPEFFDNCKVNRAEMPAVDVVVMNVSDVLRPAELTNAWFFGVLPTASAMLAIALTSMSLGNQVMCEVDLDTGVISRMILTDLPLP